MKINYSEKYLLIISKILFRRNDRKQLEFKKFKKGDEDEEIEDQLDFKKIKKGYY